MLFRSSPAQRHDLLDELRRWLGDLTADEHATFLAWLMAGLVVTGQKTVEEIEATIRGSPKA